jgi:hypothetical protein
VSDLRPIADDPDAGTVMSILDATEDRWLLAQAGDINAMAVEAMTADGIGFERLVALTIPARVNQSEERETVRLLIHPVDAASVAHSLLHAAEFLLRTDSR